MKSIFILGLTFFAFAARANICDSILSVDFEFGSISQLPLGVVANVPPAVDSISVEDGGARSGSYCAKVEVKNSSDYIYPDDSKKIRAEFSTLDSPCVSVREGDVRRYNFSFKLSPQWIFDSKDSIDIIWQFKRTDGQPDMFAAMKGHDLVVRIGESKQITWISGLKPGTWVDLSLRVTWSTKSNGKVESSYRFEKSGGVIPSATYSGPTLSTRPGKTYLKWGIYKPDNYKNSISRGEHVVYFDDISVVKD